jgi:uncharacterized membrane protein YadS
MHSRLLNFVPGILLCIVLAVGAALLEAIEVWLFHELYLEALVLAIILGDRRSKLLDSWPVLGPWNPIQ